MDETLSDYDQQARDARRAVATAIRTGDLERQPCLVCGQPGEAHHHLGYEPEHWLDVEWLCRTHHKARHFALTRQWSAIRAEKTGGFTLKELRLARGLTQLDVARELGIAQGNVSAIEARKDVAYSTLKAYVEALGGRLELTAVIEDERTPIAIS